MAVRVKVNFNGKKWGNAIFKEVVEQQTELLIEYAKEKILEIGDQIKAYNSANNMDRTGNLLDSLCWGVSYKGKMKASGFYRKATANKVSHLHEFFIEDWQETVYGRGRAQDFNKSQRNVNTNGWRVYFAILAPYWGYWESGFKMKTRGGLRFLKWNIMTQTFDQVKRDLAPASVNLTVTSKIRYTKRKLQKAYKRYSNSPYDKRLRQRFDPQLPSRFYPKVKKSKKGRR